MKEYRSGDLVPDCDEGIRYDTYDDLIFEVVSQARQDHGVRDLFDALVEPVVYDSLRREGRAP